MVVDELYGGVFDLSHIFCSYFFLSERHWPLQPGLVPGVQLVGLVSTW